MNSSSKATSGAVVSHAESVTKDEPSKPRKQVTTPKQLARNDGPRLLKPQATYLTEDGREKPDPTPLAPPIGYVKQPHLWEQMREMVRHQLSEAAVDSGRESFEEADDFDVGDDYDPTSPYEEVFEPYIPPTTPTEAGGGGGEGEAEPPSPPHKKKKQARPKPAQSPSVEQHPDLDPESDSD